MYSACALRHGWARLVLITCLCRRPAAGIGLVEALASLLGFAGAANLPGVVLPLLSQTILLWQVLFAITLLKKRITATQASVWRGGVGHGAGGAAPAGRAVVLRPHRSAAIALPRPLQFSGVFLVMAGVCLAAWPSGGGSPLEGIPLLYAAVFVVSMVRQEACQAWVQGGCVCRAGTSLLPTRNAAPQAFPALDTLLKERVFRQARATLGVDLDLFVVNSVGSLAQCAFVFLLLPAMTSLRGLTLAQLPGYLADGAAARGPAGRSGQGQACCMARRAPCAARPSTPAPTPRTPHAPLPQAGSASAASRRRAAPTALARRCCRWPTWRSILRSMSPPWS